MPDSNKRGRLILTAHPLSYFFGPEGVQAGNEEIAYDDITKDLVLVLENELGETKVYNTIGELREKFLDLQASGIFTSASAFVNNRKINRFYFDMNNLVVRLDPERRFEPIYRYYAIRSITLGEHGEYEYITGNPEAGENINNTYLVDMNVMLSESGDGSLVSVPTVGGVIRTIDDGHTYMVEFYNEEMTLVNIMPFQAKAVYSAGKDLSPDVAVVDMYVGTQQPLGTEGNECFLYHGTRDPAGDLNVTARLVYADQRTRDVTHESVIGGRLHILGLDELYTDAVTENDEFQTFSVIYELIRDNSTVPSQNIQTPTGAILNPSNIPPGLIYNDENLTIEKVMKVYIHENPNIDLGHIVYAPYVDGTNNTIQIKYFGVYKTGIILDITSMVQYVGEGLNSTQFGTQILKIKVPVGNRNNEFYTPEFMISYEQGSNYVTVTEGHSGASLPIRLVKYLRNPTSILLKSFHTINNGVTSGPINLDVLLADSSMSLESHIPTHVSIRDVIDPSYIYNEDAFNSIGNGIPLRENEDHELTTYKPVLVEFMRITEVEGNVTNVFKTGAMLHYITLQQ